MSWEEKAKAAARAVQAERAQAVAGNGVGASCRWNAYEVWLSRAKPRQESVALSVMSDLASQARHDAAPQGSTSRY